jgi:hypothetical protein
MGVKSLKRSKHLTVYKKAREKTIQQILVAVSGFSNNNNNNNGNRIYCKQLSI